MKRNIHFWQWKSFGQSHLAEDNGTIGTVQYSYNIYWLNNWILAEQLDIGWTIGYWLNNWKLDKFNPFLTSWRTFFRKINCWVLLLTPNNKLTLNLHQDGVNLNIIKMASTSTSSGWSQPQHHHDGVNLNIIKMASTSTSSRWRQPQHQQHHLP
jgi:hypothetical protein